VAIFLFSKFRISLHVDIFPDSVWVVGCIVYVSGGNVSEESVGKEDTWSVKDDILDGVTRVAVTAGGGGDKDIRDIFLADTIPVCTEDDISAIKPLGSDGGREQGCV
jgi:hypothetical protein